jgi:transglutaminase-like putative cysteine protease
MSQQPAAAAPGRMKMPAAGQGMMRGMVQDMTTPGMVQGTLPSAAESAASDTPPTVALEVVHDTRYVYASAVSLAHHLAHLQPLEDAHQQLLAFSLDLAPGGADVRASRDSFDNTQHHLSLAHPHPHLHVRAASHVQVWSRFHALQPEASPAWDELAASLRYVALAAYQPALQFVMPSPYVPRLPQLRAYALPHFPPGRPVAEAALALMHAMAADFRYESLSTDIHTTLDKSFAQKRGVCQDFAHLMAGMLRMLGLPARYVSGYLLTQPAAGVPVAPSDAGLLGADASHAWVQVWCPGTPGVPDAAAVAGADVVDNATAPAGGWLDLDPTNDLVPGTGHVRVAVGRDFGDVTPLRGVIRGGGSHGLEVGVRTRVLAPHEVGAITLDALESDPGVLVARQA